LYNSKFRAKCTVIQVTIYRFDEIGGLIRTAPNI
jgi:hypothetical protein